MHRARDRLVALGFAFLFDVPAGEREEHVVEGRLPHLDVVHQHSRVVQRPHDDRRQARGRVHSCTQRPPVVADGDVTGHQRRHGRDGRCVRLGQGHFEPGAPARLLQFLRRPLRNDPSVVDDHDVVGQLVGLLEVLGRQQHGDALAEQFADGLPDPLPRRRVQPGRRLVQEQDRGTGHQGAGQVQPPAHAARVALQHAVGGVGQLELRQELGGPGPGRGPAHVRQLTDQHQVLAPREQRVQRRILGGHADVAAYLRRVPQHVDAGHRRRTRIGPGQRGQHPHGGRLAGAVRAQEAEDGAGRHGDVDTRQRLGLPVALGQPFGLDHEVSSHRHPYRSLSKLLSKGMVRPLLTCRQVGVADNSPVRCRTEWTRSPPT